MAVIGESSEERLQKNITNYIDKLKRRYRAQHPVQSLFDGAADCGDELYSPQTQLSILQDVYGDQVVKRFPPSAQYSHRFLKTYYSMVEKQRAEVTEELMTALESSAALATSASPDTPTFRTFSLPSRASCTVSVRETQLFNDVGLKTWGAAFYLAEYILAEPLLFEGERVLELGTGTGLSAMWMLHCARPARLVLTDYIPAVLQNLRENLELNGFTQNDTLQVQSLDWDQPTNLNFTPSIIIAADVVYDPPAVRSLVKLLSQLLTINSTRACIASTIRNPPTYELFERLLAEGGLQTKYVNSVPAAFEYNRDNIRICWITKT